MVQSPKRNWADRLRWWVITALQLALGVAAVLEFVVSNWFAGLLTCGIVLTTFLPRLFGRGLGFEILPEFELAALFFVTASLFLGDVHGYYARYWWWDLLLHSTSGFLLGIFGFVLVYVLNENDRIHLHMRPRFVALFALMFSVACGTFWEIFEFASDHMLGTTMQKPMFDDPSGLTDTMWDLVVDTLGATLIALFGWWHMKRAKQSFLSAWITRFIERNPGKFDRSKSRDSAR